VRKTSASIKQAWIKGANGCRRQIATTEYDAWRKAESAISPLELDKKMIRAAHAKEKQRM